ncbi:MAG: hypothetical protein HY923_08320 [Elusimicrobia bacterium]|nr:hypothetical protein [Elusimicrobiota bacterium]
MRFLLIAALLAFAPAAGAAETPMKTKTPAAAVAALVRFTAPKGWTASDYANSEGADPVVRFENLSDAITLKVYGAPGSAYATTEAFLAGPAATSRGEAPTEEGTVTVAGRKLKLYRRRFPVNIPDPHGPQVPLMLGNELFAIVPVKGKRFVVLSCLRESPVPDAEGSGEKVWAAFLKTVKPR